MSIFAQAKVYFTYPTSPANTGWLRFYCVLVLAVIIASQRCSSLTWSIVSLTSDWLGGDKESFLGSLSQDPVQDGGGRHIWWLPQAADGDHWQWSVKKGKNIKTTTTCLLIEWVWFDSYYCLLSRHIFYCAFFSICIVTLPTWKCYLNPLPLTTSCFQI